MARLTIPAVLVLYVTLLLAMLMEIMPVYSAVSAWRPAWPLMVLLYWGLALPHRVNIGHAFVVGLMLDVLLGNLLGVNALSYSLVMYIFVSGFQKIRTFSLWQQALIVAGLILLHQLVNYTGNYWLNDFSLQQDFIKPIITSALIWPWLFLLLRKLRRQFKVQ